MGNEWISMDSSRLRPLETGSTSTPIKDESQFKEGDKCLARWTDSRKFRATIQTVLENSEKFREKIYLENLDLTFE